MNYLSNAIVLKDNSYIKQQILDFEEKSVIRIPPVFRAFLENYDIAAFTEEIFNKFYSQEFKDYYTFEKVAFSPDPEVVFYDFLPPERYIQTKANVYHYEEDSAVIEDKICIGEIAGGLLLVGHGATNSDVIYADIFGDDNRPRKISDHIFDFLQSIKLTVDPEELSRFKVTAGDMYKKWGDRHWSIR